MTVPIGALTAIMSVRGAAQSRQDILSVRQALAAAGESADVAAGGFDRVDIALEGTAKASLGASSAANKLRASQLDQIAAVERYNKVLADENATIAQLARAEAGLIRANERVTASTPVMSGVGFKGAAAEADAAAAATGRLGGAMASTMGMAKSLGLLFGAVEIVKKTIDVTKDASDFQKNMLLIQTQAGASSEQVKAFSAEILKMAGPLATAPNELATSLYHVVSASQGLLGAADQLKIMEVAAKGAKIGNADLEETTNALTAAVTSGIKGVQDYGQAMGQLNVIVGAGDMKLSDLNEALGSGILASMKTFGLSLADVGAVLDVFGDNNIRGAYAATLLRTSVTYLIAGSKTGSAALNALGIRAGEFGDAINKNGLNAGLQLLVTHLEAAGKTTSITDLSKQVAGMKGQIDMAAVSGSSLGQLLSEAFSKKSGPGLAILVSQFDRFEEKLKQNEAGAANFGQAWKATQGTVSFAFSTLAAEADAAGIGLARKLQPALTTAATTLGRDLPVAFKTASDILSPFIHDVGVGLVGAWHLATIGFKAAAIVLMPVVEGLKDFKGPLGDIATLALGAWAAFKGVEIVKGLLTTLGIVLKGAAANMIDFGAASIAGAKGFLGIGGAAKAAATDVVAASSVIAVSADGVATVVVADGELAAVGWTAMLGPIAAVGVGIALLVGMFHKSSGASKEATDAAKAYTDALKSGSSTELTDSIIKQLSDNNVPDKINALNKALGSSTYSGKQFVTAIQGGNPALAALRKNLQGVIDVNSAIMQQELKGRGRGSQGGSSDPALVAAQGKVAAAQALLKDLVAQSVALTDVQQKDLTDTKAFEGVAASIDQVAASTSVATGTATTYIEMLGMFPDKNGIVAASSTTVAAAIKEMSTAYADADQTATEFLGALQNFSQSAGTAADRATMIGATLKASNGDALNFTAALAGTTTAIDSMTDAFKNQSDQLKTQSADQAKAAEEVTKAHRSRETSTSRLAAAEAHLAQVQSNPKSTAAAIKSAQASVVSAQNSAKNSADALGAAQTAAGKAGVLAYADTELAAIKFTKNTAGVWTAAIDTNAKGAGDLVSQLQGIQNAAISAASATYQHEIKLLGDTTAAKKKAADEAYNIYVSKTSGALIAEHAQLGLNVTEAKALATAYFGMPADVKTMIEQEGANPIVDVLNKIGAQLAFLTGHPWTPKLDPSGIIQGAAAAQHAIDNMGPVSFTGAASTQHHAAGGLITGPGTGTSDSINARVSNGEYVETAAATARYRPLLDAMRAGVPLPSVMGAAGKSTANPSVVKQGRAPVQITIHNPKAKTWTESVSDAMEIATNMIGAY